MLSVTVVFSPWSWPCLKTLLLQNSSLWRLTSPRCLSVEWWQCCWVFILCLMTYLIINSCYMRCNSFYGTKISDHQLRLSNSFVTLGKTLLFSTANILVCKMGKAPLHLLPKKKAAIKLFASSTMIMHIWQVLLFTRKEINECCIGLSNYSVRVQDFECFISRHSVSTSEYWHRDLGVCWLLL